MYRSIIKAYLFLIISISPGVAHAVNLGNLTLNSYLGQPFEAEVDIDSINKEEIPSLTAKLASREIFQKSNVNYEPFLYTFKISIENRADGEPYIKIISPQSVVEPFLSMLIELNWSSGSLIREYTVLLDPPRDAFQPTTPVVQVEPVVPDSVHSESASIQEASTVKKLSVTTYGPVKRGDTLAKIALKVAPPRVQLNQLLIALHRTNSQAFSGNNMNHLKIGSMLRVPDVSEIEAISPDAADKEVKIQTVDWEAYRKRLVEDVASSVPANEESAQRATGKITTAIEDETVIPAKESSKDSLKISKGKGLATSNNKVSISEQEKIHSLQESIIAKDKALNEINERIALLEKNIQDLNSLLELESKNTPVSSIESPEAGQSPSAAAESIIPFAAEMPVVEANKPNPKVIPQISVEKPSPLVKQATAPVFIEEPPLMDKIMEGVELLIDSLRENLEYVGITIFLLLTGILGVKVMRRRKEEQEEQFAL